MKRVQIQMFIPKLESCYVGAERCVVYLYSPLYFLFVVKLGSYTINLVNRRKELQYRWVSFGRLAVLSQRLWSWKCRIPEPSSGC